MSIQFIENADWRNVYQTGSSAAATSYTTQVMVGFQDVFAFAHEAVALPEGAALAEVVPACHGSKIVQLARIPGTHALPAVQIQVCLIFNVEAETGWANVGAGRTSQAALA